jgi:PAS domain S-box-containing protein
MIRSAEFDTHKGLILAVGGRDAAVAQSTLRTAGVLVDVCQSLKELVIELNDETNFVVITEESLHGQDLKDLSTWVAQQPSWSDLPFVLLTYRTASSVRDPATGRIADGLGNVTFLERPFKAATFVSLVQSSVKARLRQFEARAYIDDVREGEQKLQIALLAGRLGSWEYDVETGVLTTSPVCRAVFGRTPDDEFTYETLLASVHPHDKERIEEAIRTSIKTGRDYVVEHRTIWPNCSVHWAEVRARVVDAKANGSKRLVGVSVDITDRKEYEESLRQLNATLEQRVKERTAKLESEITQREAAEARLRQSQKVEAIGQLTGGVAHDFNNLLMAVLANLELLHKNFANDPRAERLIDGAMQGARRGSALTQRLLAFARRQDLSPRGIDLAELVHGMTGLVKRSIGDMIELRLDIPKGLPPALADANQLELALLNLAVNARDAMENGGTLSIRVSVRPPPRELNLTDDQYLVLSVSDTGRGMDDETLGKAIDPFFSTKELGKGTGLGLSMIHGLAVQLNGSLSLKSKPGEGTTAEIWLPTAEAVALAAKLDPLAETITQRGRLKILVVDDDALIAMSTVDMLEDLGHEVIEANSAADALAILRNGCRPDLMITDYSMPRMNGADLAEAALALMPALPILVATGYADLPPGKGIDLPRLGKPYTQDQLAREIDMIYVTSARQGLEGK